MLHMGQSKPDAVPEEFITLKDIQNFSLVTNCLKWET